MIGDLEEKRANEAENRLSGMARFIRMSGVSKAYKHWNYPQNIVEITTQTLTDRAP